VPPKCAYVLGVDLNRSESGLRVHDPTDAGEPRRDVPHKLWALAERPLLGRTKDGDGE
jgi:hypothetical protein